MGKEYALRTIICNNCNQSITKRQPANRKFCSRECFLNSPRHDRKNGSIIKCEMCEKEVYKAKVHLENHKHHFCSINCANKFQSINKIEFTCKICSKLFYLSKSLTKQRNPKYCSISCRNDDPEWIFNACITGNAFQNRSKLPTKIEVMGNSILTNLGLNFVDQCLINDKIIVDVYIKEYNLIIQWDGEYWHGHPTKLKKGIPDKRQEKRMKYDKSQNAYLLKCGYNILRFWGNEITQEYNNKSDYIRRTISEITRAS